MTESPPAQAACLIEQAFALISASPDSLSNLLLVQGVIRQAERVTVEQIAAVERDGSLAAKGYKSTTRGLKDLLGWDHDTASRHVKVAQHVGPRTALDGSPLEPVLPATAARAHRRRHHHAPHRGHRRPAGFQGCGPHQRG